MVNDPYDEVNRMNEVNKEMVNNLMTCRYCLLFELGHCRKTNPYPADKEPRYLRLRTGQLLTLRFDCRRCEMTVDKLK